MTNLVNFDEWKKEQESEVKFLRLIAQLEADMKALLEKMNCENEDGNHTSRQ